MNTTKISLNGAWKMVRCADGMEFDAKVPGTVLSVFLDNKAIEDPFYRRNEYVTRELFREDYEFCREFEVSDSVLKEEHTELVCEGLDTLAEIYINGERLAQTDNMHRTWRTSLTGVMRAGTNTVRIVFRSPLKYIEEYQYSENREVQYVPCGCMKGNQILRKAHSMFGWDWGPQLIDAGIFRDIYLEAWSGARIEDVRICQRHDADGSVRLEVQAVLSEADRVEMNVHLFDGKGREIITAGMEQGGKTAEAELTVPEPKLWWPAGYGDQPLYRVEIRCYDGAGRLTERAEKTIGLRTLTVSRDTDEWGREFAFMINGVKIFVMGGNYIPEDCLYTRITEERQEYLVRSMVRANYNCVRVWGGGYYPSDQFYDLCDRYGLIVWQDLMFACNVYEVTDHFAENCREEVRDNLKRLRHHACLGIICGNNEIESAWHHWGDFQKESVYLRADYIRLFEEILPRTVRETAPDIFYWPSSPSSGGCFDDPDNENNGDTHYWAVWHGQLPFTDFGNHYFRFCSEFGFQSFPCMKTVESFTEKADRNIFSRVMESHQKNDSANGKMLYYLSENFRCPSTLEQTVYISQILQGMAVRYGVEHWRRNRGRCMGALYWQVNDNWPAPSWSSIDYFGRWKALHYMAKEFYARRAASLELNGSRIRLWAENETAENQAFRIQIYLKKMDFTVAAEITTTGSVDAFSSVCGAEIDLDDCRAYRKLKQDCASDEDPDEALFIEGVVEYEDGTVRRSVETLLPYKYLRLTPPVFRTEVSRKGTAYEISLEADAFAAFVELSVDDADVIFSENYFHMTGRGQKVIILKDEDISGTAVKNEVDLAGRIRIRSVADTFE
ncbi:MAG TPA: glycoside hydrolase family 2 protein [Candidatus Mediterraneibacter intestinavium]|nr:glycoside hydrolase family 2 protein [Candidatus Mediterraneibacter intestinavium]